MERPSYYPDSPAGIPPWLAAPAPKYQTQIGLVLVSLVAFFGLYFGIIAQEWHQRRADPEGAPLLPSTA